ncbi:MAG: biopolymer transporter ExbD [Phormidesmis sp.]
MRLPEDNEIGRTGVNILPMIDVIFAILAFFILSTLYLTKTEGLPINLPEAVTSTPQNQIDVTLTITAAGDLYLDGEGLANEAVSLETLAAKVNGMEAEGAILVTIRADAATSHGRVVAAMDQLRKIDRVRLGIATIQR